MIGIASIYSILKPRSFIQANIALLPTSDGVAPVPSVINTGILRTRPSGNTRGIRVDSDKL